MKKRFLFFLGAFLIAGSVQADAPCSGTYERAKAAIVDARVGRSLEMKLLTKVENAWRVYLSGKKNAQKDALNDLDAAFRLLDKNSTKQLPAAVRTAVSDGIAAFRRCIEYSNITTGALTVRVTRPSLDVAGAKVLVSGAIVRVNGAEVATTASSGTVTINVPAGDVSVEAVVYPMEAATTRMNMLPGGAQTIELLLADSEPSEDTMLVLDEAPEGTLPEAFASFTLRFVDLTGTRVALRSIEEIQLQRADGSGWTYWADAFRVAADGSLQPVNVKKWRDQLLLQRGRFELGVSAMDTRGRVHQGSFVFYLATFTVQGRLIAPPSNPALNVGGIPVLASVLNTNIVFRTVSAADGSFALPPVPRGNLEISAETAADGKSYYGLAVNPTNMNTRFFVNMLHTTDAVNSVPLYSIEPLVLGSGSAVIQSPPERETERRGGARPFVRSVAAWTIGPTADTNSASVTCTGAGRDAAITRTATLTVPQRTPTIILRYEIRTEEYPDYVLSQSIYNDWWYLEVRTTTNGAQLHRRLRQINSQLSLEPIWQSNGSTGEIQIELDTQTLTQNGPADVMVLASTANVGDGALATTVTATLSRNFDVSVNFIEKDTVLGFTDRWPHQTRGLSDRFSIPRAGERNYAQRSLTIGLRTPVGATVTNVKVFVKGATAFDSYLLAPDPIVDEAPGGNEVTQDTTDPSRFNVRVTFSGTASPFTTVPPPAPRLRYLIRVTVNDNGATKTAERESEIYYPLWRMPDGFTRYGQPPQGQLDWGGDDWCSMFTYHWLDTNRALISSINDISGEHAANTGHQFHHQGREIDVFHYYTFAGITDWATGNYLALSRDATRMMSGDPDVRAAARGRVTTWVSAMREHLTNLDALNDVERLVTTLGGTESGLADGWGRQLLTTGRCTVGGAVVDLAIGDWNCVKCGYNHIHDNHVHITLTDTFN